MSTIFIGELAKQPTEQDDQDTLQLYLKKITKVEDPESVLSSFHTNGVLLNVPKEQLAFSIDQFTPGIKLRCTLSAVPIMTMSIPPQIPGNSIKSVEFV
ncbi:hypothetical protein NRIC_12750 [Enterococcus florum]|uniref:Uncharacterized protein n=1 Tax=Enterococcus florum TaxID=2480627 RepID=A0A4P5PAF2_9ENTE|nr:hypothetical protein [Enterococcus florum]GCF93384.1 hypothetical protein NRIC_12750 [Enterococcus florum]